MLKQELEPNLLDKITDLSPDGLQSNKKYYALEVQEVLDQVDTMKIRQIIRVFRVSGMGGPENRQIGGEVKACLDLIGGLGG